MIKQLKESDSLKFKTLNAEEKASRGILGRLYGPVASFKAPTRNGRRYTQELWEKLFESPLIKERFANGGIFGELCHPDYEEVDLSKVACVMPQPPVKDSDGNLIAYIDIVDTPCGKIAYQLAKYGYKFGISSRGTGDIIEGYGDEGDQVDPETYQLNAFDLVEIPAVEQARLSFTESLDTKKYGKSLRERLVESVNQANDDEKKIMIEALDDLGIDLDDSAKEEAEEQVIEEAADKDKYEELIDRGFSFKDAYDIASGQKSEDIEESLLQDLHRYTLDIKDEYGEEVYNTLLDYSTNNDDNVDLGDILYTEGGWELFTNHCKENGIEVKRNPKHETNFFDEMEIDEKFIAKNWDSISEGVTKLGYKLVEEFGDKPAEEENKELTDDTEENTEVADDKSDPKLIAELQESLLTIKKLSATNKELQEKLSVCNAKEKNTSKQLKEAKQNLKKAEELAGQVESRCEENDELRDKLEESLSNSSRSRNIYGKRISYLTESLKQYTDDNQKLGHDLDRVQEQVSKMTADVEDLKSKLAESNRRLTATQDLLKKYKTSYSALKECYVSEKAKNYGVPEESVFRMLGESYKLKDIDSACEKLSQQKFNMTKLPFSLNESVKLDFKKAEKDLVVDPYISTDDDVSTLLQYLN